MVYHGESLSPHEGEHMNYGDDYIGGNDDIVTDGTWAMLNELNYKSLFN